MNTPSTVTGTIESKSWEQTDFAATEGAPNLGIATGHDLYSGAIEGDADWQGLTCTAADGSGTFDSLQRTRGTLDGRTGTFVLRMTGTFCPSGDSRAEWSVIPDSGTGELTGLTGTGGYDSTAGTNTYTLTYSFE
ncbi:DUF3224 domain-containing protein [Nocardia uniformis]|uniref:DUF3224 domain-containing protein n=1 Tax=Nocardia uniformis TaxID=53432 RepID=A0A849CDG4_9NOCA|nr:DUF3224 domain-containing protein [Nocardia uniformis]NNH73179.1 DUF3224 domain-containing protein [Nocardia uniformis]